jgi:long-chain fatty acid transport protein
VKKNLLAVLGAVSLLFAESYQVNTLSAKQMGMAHVGAGMKLGSESMHFNPGGLGFLDKMLDISAGATFIIPEVEIWYNGVKTVNDELGTPLYVYAASSITDWFSAGISFTTPYGNTVDYGKDWAGADLVQSISLAVYALQPTVAFKPISQLSIGAGPVIYFGSFEQSKDLGMASATFSGDADVAIAVNAGITYDILQDKFALGIAYRSEAKMKVAKGRTDITPRLSILEKGTFEAELPLPANLNTGISFRPIDNLLLAFDWQWVFWGTYQKKYHNAFAYRLGAQYTLIDQLDVRLGVYYDESPVDDDYLTPESPSTDKLGSTIGLSFRPISGLSIDASLLRAIAFFGRDATSGNKKDSNGGQDGLNARYEVTAWVPSVGLSYNF